jgi:glutamyl-tRNA reductase
MLAAASRARRNEPLFLIDIAVPRNIQSSVGELDNTYLFNIDDLEAIVNRNLTERSQEIRRCEPIIEGEATAFMEQMAGLDVSGVLTSLREHVQGLGDRELRRTLTRLEPISEKHKEEIRTLVHRVVCKILHAPSTVLRDEAANGSRQMVMDLTRKLYGLR